MTDWEPKAYKNYHWIVTDPDLLGGKLTLRGTRISVSLILECLANGMSINDINEAYNNVLTPDALTEVLQVASELTETCRRYWTHDRESRRSDCNLRTWCF
jgi:uncharacterized protein (DUF433 family)